MSEPGRDGPPDSRPRRTSGDRRRARTRPWDIFFRPARRAAYRRGDDLGPRAAPFVDRYPEHLGLMATLVLILTILDGAFTVVLVDSHCEEANPLMAWFLDRGVASFLLAKYALTASGLFFLVIFHTYPMFGSRVRVGHVVPVLVGLYLALLAYQTYLYVARPPRDDLVLPAGALSRRLPAIDSDPSLG